MPKGKNCPNCGAVYEINKNKCPYCQTSYFDMSAIDFENKEPFYLKIKTTLANGTPVYLTQLVKPSLGSIELSSKTEYATGGYGEKLFGRTIGSTLSTNVSFTAIADNNGNLLQIEGGTQRENIL